MITEKSPVSLLALQLAHATLRLHEGCRLEVYQCTAGKQTIGYGHNLDACPLDQALKFKFGLPNDWEPEQGLLGTGQAESILRHDLVNVAQSLENRWPGLIKNLSVVRQAVLLDMGFNLGTEGLAKFKKFLEALEHGAFERAAAEMLESRWAEQVGKRATRLAQMMKTDTKPPEAIFQNLLV